MSSPGLSATDRLKVVSALREQRAKAIANYDFPRAKIIDLQIKHISAHAGHFDSTQQTIQHQVEYDRVKELVRLESGRAYSLAIEEIYRIEASFEGRTAGLISVQTEELTAHAISLAGELELSAIRPVPDSLVLQSEAKAVAKIGDFDRAQTLFEGSARTHEQAICDRQNEILEVYDRLEKQMEGKHMEDLKTYEAKKAAKIREAKLKYDKTVDRLKKQLAKAAFKYQVVRNEVEENEFFKEIDANERMPLPKEGGGSARVGSRSESPGRSPGRQGRVQSRNTNRSGLGSGGRTSPRGRVSPRTSQRG